MMTATATATATGTATGAGTETATEKIAATTSSSPQEFIAVVLACTKGARLYPLTTSSSGSNNKGCFEEENGKTTEAEQRQKDAHNHYFKHLLPLGGIPILTHLFNTLESSDFEECYVIMNENDTATQDLISETKKKKLKITPILIEECQGSADALRHAIPQLPTGSHVMILPGDAVLEGRGVLGMLCDLHRNKNEGGCTILLSNVGEEGDDGLPLKESAKQKKGGLGRDEEEIEYIGISKPSSQVIIKQSKIDVEEDLIGDGSTPKLILPKIRLKSKNIEIRNDWNDLHIYIFSSWMIHDLLNQSKRRHSIMNLQNEILPLLISRQFRPHSVASVFGTKNYRTHDDDVNGDENNEQQLCPHACTTTLIPSNYKVLASILPRGPRLAVRCCTISSYLFANREYLSHLLQPPTQYINIPTYTTTQQKHTFQSCLEKEHKAQLHPKYQSLLLSKPISEKLTLKSCVVGRNVEIGNKCKFNNVVIMDHVKIGDNCTLQNSIIGNHVTIGDFCSLNDAQVGHGANVASHTKLKGESVVAD